MTDNILFTVNGDEISRDALEEAGLIECPVCHFAVLEDEYGATFGKCIYCLMDEDYGEEVPTTNTTAENVAA